MQRSHACVYMANRQMSITLRQGTWLSRLGTPGKWKLQWRKTQRKTEKELKTLKGLLCSGNATRLQSRTKRYQTIQL